MKLPIATIAVVIACCGGICPGQTLVPASDDHIPRVQGPLTVEALSFARKTRLWAANAFSPASFLTPALPAAILVADPPTHYPREWRQGVPAFGRNFGDALATELAADGGKYLVGALTREDPRYYPDQSENPLHRAFHAIAFTLVDRNDRGNKTLALSNLAGSLAAGFVGMAYVPSPYNNASHSFQRAAGTLGGYNPTLLVGYATQNLLSEYAPELKLLGHKLHLPFMPKN